MSDHAFCGGEAGPQTRVTERPQRSNSNPKGKSQCPALHANTRRPPFRSSPARFSSTACATNSPMQSRRRLFLASSTPGPQASGPSGLFGQTGLFSQYVIGSAELVASTLLIIGIWPRFARLHATGALIALAVMSAAVSFHLFTPLGIDPNHDGGGLFAAALAIWVTSLGLTLLRRREICALVRDLGFAFVSTAKRLSPATATASVSNWENSMKVAHRFRRVIASLGLAAVGLLPRWVQPPRSRKSPRCIRPCSPMWQSADTIRSHTLPKAEPFAATRRRPLRRRGYGSRFASTENLARFRANPNAYLPQYGGYCAWAIANGYTAAGNPNNWRIVNGRLYLNYNSEIQRRWEQDIPSLILQADANWPGVLAR